MRREAEDVAGQTWEETEKGEWRESVSKEQRAGLEVYIYDSVAKCLLG